METPVCEGLGEESSWLCLLQKSPCPSFVSRERNSTEICEKSSSESSPVRQPLEITLPIIEEDKNDMTRQQYDHDIQLSCIDNVFLQRSVFHASFHVINRSSKKPYCHVQSFYTGLLSIRHSPFLLLLTLDFISASIHFQLSNTINQYKCNMPYVQ